MNRRWIVGAAVAVAAVVAGTGQANAGTVLVSKATAGKAQPQNCIKRPLPAGAGVVRRSTTVGGPGFVTATLKAARGDWDLAVFDATTRRLVAGSANFGADERAQGFSIGRQDLIVQACRRSGSARTAKIVVSSNAISAPAKPLDLSLVRVLIPNRQRKDELTKLGLDLTEHGGSNFVEVVLHGAEDAKLLREKNFQYTTEVGDLARQSLLDRTAENRRAARATASALPSGRTGTYRRLADYTQEMKALAEQNPSLVKPLTLPFKTLTGFSVQGIEITENVRERDGKPVFLQMGAHHAREWPSAENAFEFAYELVKGYRAGDARVRRLMKSSRVIVIPVVNPEGFNTSREAGQAQGAAAGRPGNDTTDTVNFLTIPYEYQRKNCRVNNTNPAPAKDPERGDCMQAPFQGVTQFGADPNRNYGGFWGGPGASASGEPAPGGDYAQDYRGDGPFSERETQNVRALVSTRQVTTLITNHTFSNLLLRPPGIQSAGPPPDEPVYKQLGDSMAQNNGYASQPSYMLYDTTGGTEDWTYYATGGLGFTFEIGTDGFHPDYAKTIAEYEGSAPAAGAGKGGNREAYFKALENTAASAKHSTLTGAAPPGVVLRVKKSFTTETSPVIDENGVPGAVQTFPDTLNTTMVTPGNGIFRWGINPSTRPIVAQAKGRPATGAPSAPQTLSSTTPGAPCGAATPDNAACYEDIDFTVPAGPGVDNAAATVEINWSTPVSDYDITVREKSTGKVVGTSAQGTTNSESTTFGEPGESIAGKTYTVRVVNFAGAEPYSGRVSYKGPTPFRAARKESWTLTCESPSGRVGTTRTVTIDRGQTQESDLSDLCAGVAPALRAGKRTCASTKGGARGTGVGRSRLGRTRIKQRRTLRGTLLSDRKGIDRYCMKRGGGSLRVGYPTSRLSSKLSKKTRKRIKSKAIYLGTTSKAFRLAKLKVGSRTKTLRKRIKGERRYRVGKNVWYVAKGRKARVLFRARKSKVLELALADKRLTASKKSTVRLLRAWDKRGKTKKKKSKGKSRKR